MAFIENDTATQERFNLLLLEPGEIYFEDYSVYYYPSDGTEEESIKRRQRGHLKICSKSVVFVPKENQFPVLKFPMKNVQIIDEYTGDLYSRLYSKDRTLKIISEVFVEMKKGGVISPYTFKKGHAEHVFSLNYVTVDDCLPQMCQLHRASTLPPADQSAMINAIVLSRQSRVKFNTSWLEDLYEKIVDECQGNKITPLVINPGRIMLTSSRLYFQPFNNVDRLNLSQAAIEEEHKWPFKTGCCLIQVPVIKIRLKDIRKIIKRRFLLRQIGLEIICEDHSPHAHLYLSLKTQSDRDGLYNKIMSQPYTQIEVSEQQDMTLRWQNGTISNFEYLMYLNSLGDRSFYDLTQYPVMPWVVQDFTSQTLDLDNPNTFRNLSKPIGALNDERLERMQERYRDMPEPKFLYGAHYSTPGYVLFYLARICPEYVLCLQNGKFDQPDRMFNSLYDLWQNCLQGAADFKELIPEFYEGDGEFMINSGISNFGFRQDGRPIGDVDLPPWASSPREFKEKMREALECDYVSKHLHEWIDLIFGYKQRGIEAEKADNVFYYMTYEGAIDLDSITDLNERASMEIQIMEFGQVPKQVFVTPHPMRHGPRDVPRSLSTHSYSDAVKPDRKESLKDSDDLSESPLVTRTVDFTSLEKRLQYSLHKDAVTDAKLGLDGKCVFSVSQDSLLKMYSLEDKRQLRSITMNSMALSSCLVMPDNKTIVCGSWDNNVYFYNVEFGRVLDTLHAHDDAVSNVCWKNNMLITSSWDSTVKIWQFTPPSSGRGFISAEILMQLDHDSGVSHVTVDADCVLLVTGTKDGQVCVWDLHNYYMTSQHQIHAGKVNSVLLSEDKHQIISCGEDNYLRVTDLESGTEMFVRDVKDTIHCLAMVGNMLLSGTESGMIQVWDIDKAQLIHSIQAHNGAVTSLQMSGDHSILCGSVDKSVSLWQPAIR